MIGSVIKNGPCRERSVLYFLVSAELLLLLLHICGGVARAAQIVEDMVEEGEFTESEGALMLRQFNDIVTDNKGKFNSSVPVPNTQPQEQGAPLGAAKMSAALQEAKELWQELQEGEIVMDEVPHVS